MRQNINEGSIHIADLSRPDFGFFRAPGPGLGNLLFPLARAVVAQSKTNGRLVIPTFRQVKIGTYLRLEKDKRTYGDLFKSRSIDEWLLWFNSKVRVWKDTAPENTVIETGLGNQFHDIAGYADLIGQFLKDRSRHSISEADFDIAMHVRLGDFAAASLDAKSQSTQLPLDWYRMSYELAREALQTENPRVMVFSDEEPQRIIDQLDISNAVPECSVNALDAIFLMSRAKLIIGSRSTFSLWGQYLGDTKAIWPKGFELEKYKRVCPEKDLFA